MKRLDPQLLLSVGVLIVSFAALFVSMRQASLLNRQTEILLQQMKSSAWPTLSVEMNLSKQNNEIVGYSIHVRNKGVGPAVIEGIKVIVDGQTTGTWLDVVQLLDPAQDLDMSRTTSSLYSQVLSAGEEVVFLNLQENKELMSFLYGKGSSISMEICYRSIYGDYWMLRRDMLNEKGSGTIVAAVNCDLQAGAHFTE